MDINENGIHHFGYINPQITVKMAMALLQVERSSDRELLSHNIQVHADGHGPFYAISSIYDREKNVVMVYFTTVEPHQEICTITDIMNAISTDPVNAFCEEVEDLLS